MQNGSFYTIKNKNKLQATITGYGARWVNMMIPQKDKSPVNIIWGFNSIDTYKKPSAMYYGAIIGRYANRIANGRFYLNERLFRLDVNNGTHHLHGGTKGFHAVVWEVMEINDNSILLQHVSKNGDEGYPGTVQVTVRYTLTEDNAMRIDFTGITDRLTIINLTAHPYFNLNGAGAGSVLNHSLVVNADHYTPVNEKLIPAGEIKSVDQSPFDFRTSKKIGEEINADDIQLHYGNGYDHNFVLNKIPGELSHAATLKSDISNIEMKIFTTEPGLQLYTGNFMDGSNITAEGYTDDYRSAVCLETQHFPDSPNHPQFPVTTLLPGDEYRSTTVFQFDLA